VRAGTGITWRAMPEKREHGRAPIELKVDYKKLNSFFADYTKNISKGGTFIKTRKTLPVGTRFLFRLAVPGRPSPFALNGEVVHASASGDEPGMGIRFVWADDRERGSFEALVEGLMADSLGPLVTNKLLRKS
jgi:type IV pilus assembly protein PilZ